MIQRKQTIWLLLAASLNSGVFYFDLYRPHITANGTDVVTAMRAPDNYALLLIALVMTALPFLTIFMFRNRKRQVGMCAIAIVAIIAFIALTLFQVTRLTPPPSSGSYWIGAVLPVVALVFMFMAISGIRKDDKMVKSVDRLR